MPGREHRGAELGEHAGGLPALTFVDGTTLVPEAVVWATGYRPDNR